MAAYMIVQDHDYRRRKIPALPDSSCPAHREFGGKIVVQRGTVELLEGNRERAANGHAEFPSMEALHVFWNSPEYVPREGIAARCCKLGYLAVAGV
jgi:uncharacterized protein (DUF1330 family)